MTASIGPTEPFKEEQLRVNLDELTSNTAMMRLFV